MSLRTVLQALVLGMFCGLAVRAEAVEWFPQRKAEEATPLGRHERAGSPTHVAWYARQTHGSDYAVGYTGGGLPLPRFARSRTVEEGVWGRDYAGFGYHRRVWLNWSLYGRPQGYGGTYKTDGPRPIEAVHRAFE